MGYSKSCKPFLLIFPDILTYYTNILSIFQKKAQLGYFGHFREDRRKIKKCAIFVMYTSIFALKVSVICQQPSVSYGWFKKRNICNESIFGLIWAIFTFYGKTTVFRLF